jgi:hypothetical protein
MIIKLVNKEGFYKHLNFPEEFMRNRKYLHDSNKLFAKCGEEQQEILVFKEE